MYAQPKALGSMCMCVLDHAHRTNNSQDKICNWNLLCSLTRELVVQVTLSRLRKGDWGRGKMLVRIVQMPIPVFFSGRDNRNFTGAI